MKKISFKILLSAVVLSFTSCADWLDIEPDGQATNDKLTEKIDIYDAGKHVVADILL